MLFLICRCFRKMISVKDVADSAKSYSYTLPSHDATKNNKRNKRNNNKPSGPPSAPPDCPEGVDRESICIGTPTQEKNEHKTPQQKNCHGAGTQMCPSMEAKSKKIWCHGLNASHFIELYIKRCLNKC